eukprot:gene34162-34927_t
MVFAACAAVSFGGWYLFYRRPAAVAEVVVVRSAAFRYAQRVDPANCGPPEAPQGGGAAPRSGLCDVPTCPPTYTASPSPAVAPAHVGAAHGHHIQWVQDLIEGVWSAPQVQSWLQDAVRRLVSDAVTLVLGHRGGAGLALRSLFGVTVAADPAVRWARPWVECIAVRPAPRAVSGAAQFAV